MEEKYRIKTASFEGPLDLLLSLIEKRKFFINDISLAKIADDYIQYIKEIQKFSIKDSSDFILIASTLILIKSRSLLPTLNLTLEEEQNIEDLEDRLKVYKQIRDLSACVGERFGKKIIFFRSDLKNIDPIFSPDNKITPLNLLISIKEVLSNLPTKEVVPKKVVKNVLSLEKMIDSLSKKIKENMKISFNDFSQKTKSEKINVIVSFLAMLELVKQGIVMVEQKVSFGDIDIEGREIHIPFY